jgi:hypothetical protein
MTGREEAAEGRGEEGCKRAKRERERARAKREREIYVVVLTNMTFLLLLLPPFSFLLPVNGYFTPCSSRSENGARRRGKRND